VDGRGQRVDDHAEGRPAVRRALAAVGGGIDFALFGWHRFYRARRGLPANDASPAEFDEALEVGALDQAREILRTSRGAATELAMRAQLCLALLRAGRRDEAAVLFGEVERVWRERREPTAGEAVARWHAETGDRAAAVRVADAVVALANDRVACWRVLVDHGGREGSAALVARIGAAAAAHTSTWRRAELTAELAVTTAAHDPDAAIRHLLAARGLGIGADETIAAMHRAVALGADRASLLAATLRANVAAEQRDSLERDMRRATITDDEVFAVLAAHVQLANDLCAASGTKLVLLGYPFAMPRHEERMQRVATAAQVPFVSTVAPFAAKLAASQRSDWFADEIHCSARGYDLMGSLVADRLAALWR
jgi:hypothetical protein